MIESTRLSRRQFLKVAIGSAAILGVGLAVGCGKKQDEGGSTNAEDLAKAGGTLVVVFSWTGNTLKVADRLVENLGVDWFRIEPATPYPTDHDEGQALFEKERDEGVLPELASTVDDWDNYSTIYLGFPTWWSHLPLIVKSFLAQHDCAGKVIHPFNTNGGGGISECLADLEEACNGADIRKELSIFGEEVDACLDQVDTWIQENAEV